MRVNVYSQELTSETRLVSKQSDGIRVTGFPCNPNGKRSGLPREELPGFLIEVWRNAGKPSYQDATNPFDDVREEPIVYHAVQLVLHSSPMLHCSPMDDDRSAVTFWLPRSAERREALAKTFEKMARLVREAEAGTGVD